MPRSTRFVALSCALTLPLAACSAASDADSSPTATQIISTTARPTAPAEASTAADATIKVGGPETVSVAAVDVVANGLDAPWDIEVTADGSALLSARDTGLITRVRSGVATVLNGPGVDALRTMAVAGGEGGLLGLAVSPVDPTLLYAYVTREGDNAVVRMTLHDDLLSLPTVILEGIPKADHHDGGRLAFGPDGFLYVGTGDAGDPEAAQDEDSLAGKILRVVADGTDADGDAAPGNPWDNRAYSMGHRNVEGFDWAIDGRMYASELGQDASDELNLIVAGGNYGWPVREGFDGQGDAADYIDPLLTWTPDEASPSGVAVTHEGIYVAALKGERVWRVPLTATGIGTPQALLQGEGRIRDVAAVGDGTLLVLTNNTDGRGTPSEGDDQLLRVTVA